MIRAYPHSTPANHGKLNKVEALFVAYRDTAHALANSQWRILFETGRFNKNAKVKVASPISARYVQTCQYQVEGMLTSFMSNRANDFKAAVDHSSLAANLKAELLYINRYQRWYAPTVAIKGQPVAADTLRLARNIMRGIRAKHRIPCMRAINMALDTKVAEVQPARAGKFPYWIKLATLESGKPIYLPILANSYFESQAGLSKAFIQLNQSEAGIQAVLMKEVAAQPYLPELGVLGLDLGLRTLITTSEGDLLSRGFIAKLYRYDRAISTLAANRQRLGLRTRCQRYDGLVNKLRSFLKNEIHRVLKKLLLNRKPGEVVVERLDFRNPELSRRMNRLLSNFGKRQITEALAGYAEQYGFKITEVNPAYTSQECFRCKYVAKNNRRGEQFNCKHCGLKCHADINAPKNIRDRRSIPSVAGIYIKRRAILDELTHRFIERCKQRRYRSPRCTEAGEVPYQSPRLNEFHDLL